MTAQYELLGPDDVICSGDEHRHEYGAPWMPLPSTAIGLRVIQAVNRGILPADESLQVCRPTAPTTLANHYTSFSLLTSNDVIDTDDEYQLLTGVYWTPVPEIAVGLTVIQAVNRAVLPANETLRVRRWLNAEPKRTPVSVEVAPAPRRRLPNERPALIHKFAVGGYEVYITVGLYSDGTPGEVFLLTAKEGSTVRGLLDTIGILLSLALQSGIPLEKLCEKLRHMRFEPQGIAIGCSDITMATSICDYIARWMSLRFLPAETTETIDGAAPMEEK